MTDDVVQKNRRKYLGYKVQGTGVDAKIIAVDLRDATGVTLQEAKSQLRIYHLAQAERLAGLARMHKDAAKNVRSIRKKDIPKRDRRKKK